MRICFVLPGFTRQPIGGYKIIFEYANRLQACGNEITILFLNEHKLENLKIPSFIKNIIINHVTSIEPKWFPMNKDIIKISSKKRNYLNIAEQCDAVVATGIQTAEIVKENFNKSKKYYFIQDYESWICPDNYVTKTYGYGFYNIVISNWLKNIVDKYANRPSLLLKNPIDIDLYKCKYRQDERQKHTIGILYHEEKHKGVEYALKAVYKLKARYLDLLVEMFGMFPVPKELPEWIHYKRGATQKETIDIYNKVQVFLCASIEEGYGLTGLEAMACGACLVSTAYKGVLEYAEDGYNALLSPIKDVDKLVEHVSALFDNLNERERISINGIESVKRFSWDEAMKKMNSILLGCVSDE